MIRRKLKYFIFAVIGISISSNSYAVTSAVSNALNSANKVLDTAKLAQDKYSGMINELTTIQIADLNALPMEKVEKLLFKAQSVEKYSKKLQNKAIGALEAKDSMLEKYNFLNERAERIKAKAEKTLAEASKIKSKYETYKAKISDIQNKVGDIQQKASDLKDKADSYKEKIKDTADKVDSYAKKAQDVKNKVNSYKETLQDKADSYVNTASNNQYLNSQPSAVNSIVDNNYSRRPFANNTYNSASPNSNNFNYGSDKTYNQTSSGLDLIPQDNLSDNMPVYNNINQDYNQLPVNQYNAQSRLNSSSATATIVPQNNMHHRNINNTKQLSKPDKSSSDNKNLSSGYANAISSAKIYANQTVTQQPKADLPQLPQNIADIQQSVSLDDIVISKDNKVLSDDNYNSKAHSDIDLTKQLMLSTNKKIKLTKPKSPFTKKSKLNSSKQPLSDELKTHQDFDEFTTKLNSEIKNVK